jgi:quinolinate synthase
MAMNSLRKLLHILETGENEIFVEKDIINLAKSSIEKLLKFTSANKRVGLANDA